MVNIQNLVVELFKKSSFEGLKEVEWLSVSRRRDVRLCNDENVDDIGKRPNPGKYKLLKIHDISQINSASLPNFCHFQLMIDHNAHHDPSCIGE